MHRADAVVFHLLNLRQWTKQDVDEINKWRRDDDQKFVIFNMESAVGLTGRVDFEALNGFFNWTMSFRSDSDVYSPYGMVLERETEDDNEILDDFGYGKTKSALWLVSNCNARSEREKYVGELIRQGIQVDVFGACGDKCDKKSCDQEIHKEYRYDNH